VPESQLLVTPVIEAQLNERQKEIINYVLENGAVTSGWCRRRFNVAYQTVYRDLNGLKDLVILKQEGAGRSTRYVMRRGNELSITFLSPKSSNLSPQPQLSSDLFS
jgi:predicted HTH transcriptional regulator